MANIEQNRKLMVEQIARVKAELNEANISTTNLMITDFTNKKNEIDDEINRLQKEKQDLNKKVKSKFKKEVETLSKELENELKNEGISNAKCFPAFDYTAISVNKGSVYLFLDSKPGSITLRVDIGQNKGTKKSLDAKSSIQDIAKNIIQYLK